MYLHLKEFFSMQLFCTTRSTFYGFNVTCMLFLSAAGLQYKICTQKFCCRSFSTINLHQLVQIFCAWILYTDPLWKACIGSVPCEPTLKHLGCQHLMLKKNLNAPCCAMPFTCRAPDNSCSVWLCVLSFQCSFCPSVLYVFDVVAAVDTLIWSFVQCSSCSPGLLAAYLCLFMDFSSAKDNYSRCAMWLVFLHVMISFFYLCAPALEFCSFWRAGFFCRCSCSFVLYCEQKAFILSVIALTCG